MTNSNQDLTADEARVAHFRERADRTRARMSETIQALEHRLSPQDWRDKAASELAVLEKHIKAGVREELLEVKAILEEEMQEAKVAVSEVLESARAAVKEDVIAAKDAVKEDVAHAIADAKSSARAATLGRLEDFATQAGDVMNNSKDTLVDTVRQNPIPAALIGVGLAWLLMNRSTAQSQRLSAGRSEGMRSRGYGRVRDRGFDGDYQTHYGHGVDDFPFPTEEPSEPRAHPRYGGMDSAGQVLSGAKERAGDLAEKVRDQASGLAHRAAEGASGLAHDAAATTSHLWHDATDAGGRAYDRASRAITDMAHEVPVQARRAERAVTGAYLENPLAIGAAVLAGGALIGMALPRTDREDALLGGARNKFLANAKGVAHDAFESVQHMGEDVKGVLTQPDGA